MTYSKNKYLKMYKFLRIVIEIHVCKWSLEKYMPSIASVYHFKLTCLFCLWIFWVVNYRKPLIFSMCFVIHTKNLWNGVSVTKPRYLKINMCFMEILIYFLLALNEFISQSKWCLNRFSHTRIDY